jgi:hypothetical protein
MDKGSTCPACGAKVTVRALVGPVTAGDVDSPDEAMKVISEVELATCRKCSALLSGVKSEPALAWEETRGRQLIVNSQAGEKRAASYGGSLSADTEPSNLRGASGA